ncbi:MAG: LPS-assembly protein LptD [Planctomycetota bacterium]|jgi:hypothetical protein
MAKKRLFTLLLLVLAPMSVSNAIDADQARIFSGQDLHIFSPEVLSYQLSTGEHTLVFRDGFSMSIDGCEFSSAVWLKAIRTEFRGRTIIDYELTAYLKTDVSVTKDEQAKAIELRERIVNESGTRIVQFDVSGEVFVTAGKRKISNPRELELYKEASAAAASIGRKFVVREEVLIPGLPGEKPRPKEEILKPKVAEPPAKAEREIFAPAVEAVKPEVKFWYPVNISPAGEEPLEIETDQLTNGTNVATVTNRFYLWQKRDEKGGLLELQADEAVLFYADEGSEQEIAAAGVITGIYMAGDVLMVEGSRTIRCDQMYYDFPNKRALAINAVMRSFDANRRIPIYVRAAKIKRLSENKFAAENITLTSSEFHQPQISLTASDVLITDTTVIDEEQGKVSDASYDAQLRDIRLKMGKSTIFRWPFMRSNLQRPDIPLESLRIGNDNSWGTSIESRWYLSRLLGLREPEGVDSRLNLDYFSKRGTGAGVEIEYEMDKYYGRIAGYVIRDSGEDRLGRDSSRKNIDAGNDIRGRFGWLHRHFLPYKWQLTTGIGYSSDENFIESFYRKEFNVSTQETYLHLKRIEDNRAISILGKVRINDFADELDQMPAFEYHLTGESLFNDTFTLYSDTQVARMRQRIGDRHTTLIDENMFTFGWQRMELDMPMELAGSLSAGRKQSVRVVPFIAGTFGYDDRSGFRSTLVDGSNTGSFGDKNVWLGELGVRVFPRPLWKEYPNVTSRLWDLNRLRHIIKPWVTAVTYVESDSVVKQRDTLNFGISQRLQTKRQGTSGARTIDWMRLDTEFTWVDDSASADTSAPDRFIWARPMVPLSVFSAPEIFSGDLTTAGLRRFEMFGPRRNYFAADYIWRLSDTAVIISDMNFDMQSGVVQQFNFGLSRLVWPDLSLFIGSRYLRNINILDQKGSNTFTFAATYVLDPRYTLVFSQQFDFDYGANIRSNITLLRKYHRMRYGFTYSADGSLDRQAIVLSIWPQGVPEMALGPRRYMGIGEESYLNR